MCGIKIKFVLLRIENLNVFQCDDILLTMRAGA